MHLLRFFYLWLEISKGWGCNFTWSFGKVMRIKSLKMVFVARIIRHELCMIYAFLNFFVQNSFLTKNCFHTAEINLTTRGPLYTCLVYDEYVLCLWYFFRKTLIKRGLQRTNRKFLVPLSRPNPVPHHARSTLPNVINNKTNTCFTRM